MPDQPEIRVRWTVTLHGPRAADNLEHSVGGSGETPAAALASLRETLNEKADLLHNFWAQLRAESDAR